MFKNRKTPPFLAEFIIIHLISFIIKFKCKRCCIKLLFYCFKAGIYNFLSFQIKVVARCFMCVYNSSYSLYTLYKLYEELYVDWFSMIINGRVTITNTL